MHLITINNPDIKNNDSKMFDNIINDLKNLPQYGNESFDSRIMFFLEDICKKRSLFMNIILEGDLFKSPVDISKLYNSKTENYLITNDRNLLIYQTLDSSISLF